MTRIRNWPARTMYILLALALVLSLSVTGVVPGAGSQSEPALAAGAGNPELLVYIERPAEDLVFDVREVFYVNAVVAYKDIAAEGTASKVVTATIDTGDNAELVDGETAGKSATIGRNCLGDFWWKVRCTGEGATDITVTAQASGLADAMDSVTVIQERELPDCDLVITRIQPGRHHHYVDVWDRFDVKVKLTNTGDEVARDVEAWIHIDPDTGAVTEDPHRLEVGDIHPGRDAYVLWNLHCQDESTVTITVGADAEGVVPCPPVHWTVYQGEEDPDPEPEECLRVVMDAPEKVCTLGCDWNVYSVKATIYNENPAEQDVEATLSWTPGGRASTDEDRTKDVGIIAPDDSEVVEWEVKCTGVGPVTFTVEAEGQCGRASSTTEVEQKKVLAELIEPASGTEETHNVCTTFNVTAHITNCTCGPLADVNVQLLWPDSVDITEDSRVEIKWWENGEPREGWTWDPNDFEDPRSLEPWTFCPCCEYEITWTNLHCKEVSPDWEEFQLKVFDEDGELLDDDHFYLLQTEKAHLSTGVEVFPWDPEELPVGLEEMPSAPEIIPCEMGTTPLEAVAVGQQFMIVVPVMNTGGATAEDVGVSLNITGETDLVPPDQEYKVYEYEVGTIPGGTAEKLLIPALCTGDGVVTVEVIDVWGIDHGTGEAIPDDNLFACGYREVKQIPIDIAIVQPPPPTEVTCLESFVVKVRVENESEYHDLDGVTATIYWWTGEYGTPTYAPYTGAEFLDPQQPYTRSLGNLAAGKEASRGWNMRCTDAGEVYFRVTIASEKPAWSDTVSTSVYQAGYADLNVEILSPMEDAWYGTGEEFAVTAKVWADDWMLGVTHVHDVSVTIPDWLYWLDVEGDRTIIIDEMPVGEEHARVVSWNVRAVKSGTQCTPWRDSVGVIASGPCLEPGYYFKGITIYPAANLLVEITDAPEMVELGAEFEIEGRVTNTGWADATGVKLHIAVQPEGSAEPFGYEKNIGSLIGYGQQDYEEFTWTLRFSPGEWPPMADITITASGYDECGWYKHDVWPDPGWWIPDPNRPIADKFLHSANALVVQTGERFLMSIAAVPANVSLDVNDTRQLAVTATYSDNTTAAVTNDSDYTSDNEDVATVSATGLITAVGEGEATITVTYTEDGLTRTAYVSVEVSVNDPDWDPWDYDQNEDGIIDKSEALQALQDYFDEQITKEQVLEVLQLYFAS